MPCDRSFGVLEKKFKKRERINTPQGYRDIISAATKCDSVTMEREHWLDFKDLEQYIQHRKAKTVKFSKARKIVIDGYEPWTMLLITSEGQERVDLNKRTNRDEMLDIPDMANYQLKYKYQENQQITIGPSKVSNLVKLRPFLTVPGRRWVEFVQTGQDTAVPRPRTLRRRRQAPAAARTDPGQNEAPPEEPRTDGGQNQAPVEEAEEPDDNLGTDNIYDDYTAVPPPDFPPGYVEDAREDAPHHH